MRKSCGRSDQRRPPRATLPKRRCTPFDAGRIDEDLVERPRQRQAFHLGAFELERDGLARQPVALELEEVGADRRLDEVDEAAQDAVVVEAGDVLQLLLDGGADRGFGRGALRLVLDPRIEARIEQLDESRGDGAVPGEGLGEIILRVGDLDLAQVAAERPHHGDVAPAEPRLEDEAVEGVRLGEAPEQGEQRRLDQILDLVDVDDAARGALERHVVEPHALGLPGERPGRSAR